METFEMLTLIGGILVGLGLSIGIVGVVFYFWGME